MIQKLIIKLILKKGGINVLLLVGDLIVKTTKSKKDDEMWAKIKPGMRKRMFQRIKAGTKGGPAGVWSARKAQLLARMYKKKGGGYKN